MSDGFMTGTLECTDIALFVAPETVLRYFFTYTGVQPLKSDHLLLTKSMFYAMDAT